MRALVWGLSLLFSLSANALNCAKERKQFCASAEVGKPELINCLIQNEAKLGLQCRASLAKLKDKQKANPCHADITKHCSNVPLKDGPLMLCLLKNEAALAPTCAADFKKKKIAFDSKEPCAQDLITRCYAEVQQDGGLARRCLFKHKGKLLARCESVIAAQMQKMRSKNPCFDDTEKFCPAMVMPGQIDTCLITQMKNLAPECKKKMEAEVKASSQEPCRRDIRTYCKPGKPKELLACLNDNSSKLSKACVAFREGSKARITKLQKNCEADRRKYCMKIPPTGGQILDCLKRNKAMLSPACSSSL